MHTYQLGKNTITVLSHEAMATIYELHIIHDDKNYMAQAALEVFILLDQIEHDLSRFIENSDISKINSLKRGQTTIVGTHAFICLKTALDYYMATDTIFDIGLGLEIERIKSGGKPDPNIRVKDSQLEMLELNKEDNSVSLNGDSINLDLGGIGKGYAIDRMRDLLTDWEINQVMIQGGQSTVLAMEPPEEMDGWPVSISHPLPPNELIGTLSLKTKALSSSGLQKGTHIVDPRNYSAPLNNMATWVLASSAVESDILSTTFMIMTKKEIQDIYSKISGINYFCVDSDGEVYRDANDQMVK